MSAAGHRIRWYVYAGTERIPHTSKMRGTWGYDAACSCGWDSRTGGATRRYVQGEVWLHKTLSPTSPTPTTPATPTPTIPEGNPTMDVDQSQAPAVPTAELRYPDLPAWAQPGATAAIVGGGDDGHLVTIARVTKSQIIATIKGNSGEYRFDRAPVEPSRASYERWGDTVFRLRGSYSRRLADPDEPGVARSLLRDTVKDAMAAVRSRIEYTTKEQRDRAYRRDPKETRTVDEIALADLDELENIVRAARKRIEQTLTIYGERAALADARDQARRLARGEG